MFGIFLLLPGKYPVGKKLWCLCCIRPCRPEAGKMGWLVRWQWREGSGHTWISLLLELCLYFLVESQGNGKWWREPEGQCSGGQESWALPAPPLCIAFSWNPVSLSLWSQDTLVLFAFPSWQLWSPGKEAVLLIENILNAWLSRSGKEMYVWNLSWSDPNVSLVLFHPKTWPVFSLCW